MFSKQRSAKSAGSFTIAGVLFLSVLANQIAAQTAQPFEAQHVMTERVVVGFEKGPTEVDGKSFPDLSYETYSLSKDGKVLWVLVKKYGKIGPGANWQAWAIPVNGGKPVQTRLYQPDKWNNASIHSNGDGTIAWIRAQVGSDVGDVHIMRGTAGQQFSLIWDERIARDRKDKFSRRPRIRTTIAGDAVYLFGEFYVTRLNSDGTTMTVGNRGLYKVNGKTAVYGSNLSELALSGDGSVWLSALNYEKAREGRVIVGSSLQKWQLVDHQGPDPKATMSSLDISGDGKVIAFNEYFAARGGFTDFVGPPGSMDKMKARDLDEAPEIRALNWDGSRVFASVHRSQNGEVNFIEHLPTGKRLRLPDSNIYHWIYLDRDRRGGVSADLSVFSQANSGSNLNDNLPIRIVVGTRKPHGNSQSPKFSFAVQDGKIKLFMDVAKADGIPSSVQCKKLWKRYLGASKAPEGSTFQGQYNPIYLKQNKENPTHFESGWESPRNAISDEKIREWAFRFTIPNKSTRQIVTYDAWTPSAHDSLAGEIDHIGPGIDGVQGGPVPGDGSGTGGRVVLGGDRLGVTPDGSRSGNNGIGNNDTGSTPDGTMSRRPNGSSGTDLTGNRATPDSIDGGRGNPDGRMMLVSPDRNVQSGETVLVPILLRNAENVANINFVAEFSKDVIQPIEKPIKGNVYPANSIFAGNTAESGKVRVGVASSSGITGSGTATEIRFKVTGEPGDKTPVRLTVSKIDDPLGNELQIVTESGILTVVDEDGLTPGDGDGDGKLTALDAMMALKMSVKLIAEKNALDIDKDRSVTSRDAVLIMQRALGK